MGNRDSRIFFLFGGAIGRLGAAMMGVRGWVVAFGRRRLPRDEDGLPEPLGALLCDGNSSLAGVLSLLIGVGDFDFDTIELVRD